MSADIDQHLDEQRDADPITQRPDTVWNETEYHSTDDGDRRVIYRIPTGRTWTRAWISAEVTCGLEAWR